MSLLLSIEEMAYGLSMAGNSEYATAFLFGALGERPKAEMEGRLFAAGHALLARGLMQLDLEKGTRIVNGELMEMLGMIINRQFTLRCTRFEGGVEQILNYFVVKGEILEQATLLEVITSLDKVPLPTAIQHVARFLSVETASLPVQPAGRLSFEQLDSLKRQAAEMPLAELSAELTRQAGMTAELASEFARALARPQFRASVTRLEASEEANPSRQGFLVLKGENGLWLMNLDLVEGHAHAEILRGSRNALDELVLKLLS